jgi:hypothetical protein
MFEFFYYLTVLIVIVGGIAMFNFQPSFIYSYNFREKELVINLLGLELKRIAYQRIRSADIIDFRLSIVSALKGSSFQTRPTKVVALTLRDNLVVSITPPSAEDFCLKIRQKIQTNPTEH